MGIKSGGRVCSYLRKSRRLTIPHILLFRGLIFMFTYNTKGTCSRQIIFDVDSENKIHNVKFIGGCGGNLQGISKLIEGKNIDDVHNTLKGIKCRNNTSCPDQLANAIAAYKERENARV